MNTKVNLLSFEWDKGNSDKSLKKHGITIIETEELFIDEKLITLEDIKHSQNEKRFMAIGNTSKGKLLFVVYAHRGQNIRVISVRIANKKDRKVYEKA